MEKWIARACVAAIIAVSSVARASAGTDDADTAAGIEDFENEDFVTALAAFRRADEAAPSATGQYQIALTCERLHRATDAHVAFERYLQRAGTPRTVAERQFQDDIRARVYALRVSTRCARLA